MHDKLAEEIQQVQIKEDCNDSWIWKLSSNRLYSVKSAYNSIVADASSSDNHVYKLIWRIKCPSKVTAVAWKYLQNKMATRSNLSERGVSLPNNSTLSPFCAAEEESDSHLFLTCDFAIQTWKLRDFWWNIAMVRGAAPKDHLIEHNGLQKGKRVKKLWLLDGITTIWSI